MDHLCYLYLVLLHVHARLFVDALWSPAWKGLTSWLSFVMSNCERCHFPIGILGQVSCLIVSIPDLFPLSYFCRRIPYCKRIFELWTNKEFVTCGSDLLRACRLISLKER